MDWCPALGCADVPKITRFYKGFDTLSLSGKIKINLLYPLSTRAYQAHAGGRGFL
jgi:hypothetical protein